MVEEIVRRMSNPPKRVAVASLLSRPNSKCLVLLFSFNSSWFVDYNYGHV
jgi:hypothetical protein